MPGKSIDSPNIYSFGTPYNQMYSDLYNLDINLYTQNGMLKMLDRNRRLKNAPERFQDNHDIFDILITCEERCFDAVIDELLVRGGRLHRPVIVINVEIRDNHEEAAIGGKHILAMCNTLETANDRHVLHDEIDLIMDDFAASSKFNIVYATAFY